MKEMMAKFDKNLQEAKKKKIDVDQILNNKSDDEKLALISSKNQFER